MSKYPIYNQPIEIEPRLNNGPFARKYPFNELKIGQSFFVSPEENKKIQTIRASCSAQGKRLNRKFAAKLVNGWIQVGRIE